MPDIDWSPEFRLAVIEKIAWRLVTRLKPQGRCDAYMAELAECIIALSLSMTLQLEPPYTEIEAALGCTLADVREEMERNAE